MAVTNYHTVNGLILGETTVGSPRVDYLTDALGSVTATVNQAGQVVDTYRYKPFGLDLAVTDNGPRPAFGWGGDKGYRQTENKFSEFYVRARHDDATNGRWSAQDPIGLRGGINKFKYVRNNPISWNDPTGTIAAAAGGAIGWGTGGGGATAGGVGAGDVAIGGGEIIGGEIIGGAIGIGTIAIGIGIVAIIGLSLWCIMTECWCSWPGVDCTPTPAMPRCPTGPVGPPVTTFPEQPFPRDRILPMPLAPPKPRDVSTTPPEWGLCFLFGPVVTAADEEGSIVTVCQYSCANSPLIVFSFPGVKDCPQTILDAGGYRSTGPSEVELFRG